MKFETDPARYKAVLQKVHTPTWDEFSEVAKITVLTLAAVGTFGYGIFVVMGYLPA